MEVLIQQVVLAARSSAVNLTTILSETPENHTLIQLVVGHHVHGLRRKSTLCPGTMKVLLALQWALGGLAFIGGVLCETG